MGAFYVRLPDEVSNQLDQLSAMTGRSKTYYAKQAILQFVDKESEREKMKQEAVKAYENYKKTGLHVTEQEANDWLLKLAKGQNVEPPKCHV